MKKILLIFLLLPLLNNCAQHTAMVGSAINLAYTGNITQASTSLTRSLVINKLNQEYKDELNSVKYCPTIHTAELNQIFFETLESIDCYYDPMSIYR